LCFALDPARATGEINLVNTSPGPLVVGSKTTMSAALPAASTPRPASPYSNIANSVSWV